MNRARRRLPTSASIRRIVSVDSLIVVGFIPSGGRPIAPSLSAMPAISKSNTLTPPFILIYDIVYVINDVVYFCNGLPFIRRTDLMGSRCSAYAGGPTEGMG